MSAAPLPARFDPLVRASMAIAVGGVVRIGLALALVPPPSLPSVCDALECGPEFVMGDPIGPTPCAAAGAPLPACVAAGDFVYNLTIETSAILFGELRLTVFTSNDSIYLAPDHGGFFVWNLSGTTVASYELAHGGELTIPATGRWTYDPKTTGVSAGTHLTSVFWIGADVGSADTRGEGLGIEASIPAGTTAGVALP